MVRLYTHNDWSGHRLVCRHCRPQTSRTFHRETPPHCKSHLHNRKPRMDLDARSPIFRHLHPIHSRSRLPSELARLCLVNTVLGIQHLLSVLIPLRPGTSPRLCGKLRITAHSLPSPPRRGYGCCHCAYFVWDRLVLLQRTNTGP